MDYSGLPPRRLPGKWLVALVVLAALIAALNGCNSNPAVAPQPADDVRVEGAVVADLNTNATTVVGSIRSAGEALSTGALILGDDTIRFASASGPDSLYLAAFSGALAFPTADYELTIKSDSGATVATVTQPIPDSFTITDVVPPNRLVNGLAPVLLGWSPSDRVTSYAVAAVPAGQQYSGNGYSAYAVQFAVAGTIPAEAFFVTPGATVPDTGLYYLYAYAIVGSPDSALTANRLPVPIPSVLTDNISETGIRGRFGAVLVSRFDSVRVASITAEN